MAPTMMSNKSLDTLAVSVHYLKHYFLEEVRAAGFSEDSTIYEIEDLHSDELGVIRRKGAQIVSPEDGELGASYVHSIPPSDLEDQQRHVGEATHMLSYSWSYSIGSIVDTLVDFCDENSLDPRSTYVWICCLCVNQHRVAKKLEQQKERSSICSCKKKALNAPSVDFFAEFGERVSSIQSVLAMMSPWSKPVYLQRIWCIYEFYMAHKMNCEVTIVMPPSEKDALEKDLFGKTGNIDKLYEVLANTKIESAEASIREDKEAILQKVEAGPGYETLNNRVNELLWAWVFRTLKQAVTKREQSLSLSNTYDILKEATWPSLPVFEHARSAIDHGSNVDSESLFEFKRRVKTEKKKRPDDAAAIRLFVFFYLMFVVIVAVMAAGEWLQQGTVSSGVDASEALMPGVDFSFDNGTRASGLEIVKAHGYQWVRVRVFVNPGGDYGVLQDLEYVKTLAREAKKKHGFKLLIAFHYSYWWAKHDGQWPPWGWNDHIIQNPDGTETAVYTVSSLSRGIKGHTREVMEALLEQDTWPDAVQIGNEISNGMLWDLGKLPSDWRDTWHGSKHQKLPKEWDNLKSFIQSGVGAIDHVVDMARSHSQTVGRPLIVMHLGTGGDAAFTEDWMKAYVQLGGVADVIGLNWYPMDHLEDGLTIHHLVDNIRNLKRKFRDKQVWIVETGYYHKSGYCKPDDRACQKRLPFPHTVDGQLAFLKELRKTLLRTHCSAVFYWGSHWSQPEKWLKDSKNGTAVGGDWDLLSQKALVDSRGRALISFGGLVGPVGGGSRRMAFLRGSI